MPSPISLPDFVARRELAAGLADLDENGYASLIAMLIEEDLARLEQLKIDPEAREVLVRVYRSAAIAAVKTICLVVMRAGRVVDWEAVGQIVEVELQN